MISLIIALVLLVVFGYNYNGLLKAREEHEREVDGACIRPHKTPMEYFSEREQLEIRMNHARANSNWEMYKHYKEKYEQQL